MYFVLFFAVGNIAMGVCIYYVQRNEIGKNNLLYKYRPKNNSILLRLKLFKDDVRFNYFCLIPYILSWNIFFLVFIAYIIFWSGVKKIGDILSNKITIFVFMGILLLFALYLAIIEQVKFYCADKVKNKK